MEKMEFEKLAAEFKNAALDGKIDIYITTAGLTSQQYRELLGMFPRNELHRLEEALG